MFYKTYAKGKEFESAYAQTDGSPRTCTIILVSAISVSCNSKIKSCPTEPRLESFEHTVDPDQLASDEAT